jgi:peptidyl-tRNA hydrolase
MTNGAIENRHETDDTDPWALNLVVRVERDQPVLHDDLLEAAALAVTGLMLDERAENEWKAAIDRWHDGRIRKLCRRARGAKWEATSALEHVDATRGTATVRAFPPTAMDAQPTALFKLQMSGTDFEKAADVAAPVNPVDLVVWMTPDVTMTSAKAAVQSAHAAQLAVERMRGEYPDRLAEWTAGGRGLTVREATKKQWDHLVEFAEGDPRCVVIHDAGFTEIEAGSLTAIGVLPVFGWE